MCRFFCIFALFFVRRNRRRGRALDPANIILLVTKDPELLELISTPFPGIKAIISINDVTSDSTIDERLSKVHVNDQNN
jgi:hypothetical protein